MDEGRHAMLMVMRKESCFINFRHSNLGTQLVTRDKEQICMITRGSVLLADITILNTYAPDNRASNYVRQRVIELLAEIDEPAIMIRNFTITQITVEFNQKSVTER